MPGLPRRSYSSLERALADKSKEAEALRADRKKLKANNSKLRDNNTKKQKKIEKLRAPKAAKELIPKPEGQPGRRTTTGSDGRTRKGYNIAVSMKLDKSKPEDKQKYDRLQNFIHRCAPATAKCYGDITPLGLAGIIIKVKEEFKWFDNYAGDWPVEAFLRQYFKNVTSYKNDKDGGTLKTRQTKSGKGLRRKQPVEESSAEESGAEESADDFPLKDASSDDDNDSDEEEEEEEEEEEAGMVVANTDEAADQVETAGGQEVAERVDTEEGQVVAEPDRAVEQVEMREKVIEKVAKRAPGKRKSPDGGHGASAAGTSKKAKRSAPTEEAEPTVCNPRRSGRKVTGKR